MTYTVYGAINDGRNGYPNMPQQLSWTEWTNSVIYPTRSYEEALQRHLAVMNAAVMKGAGTWLFEEIKRGRVNGMSCRDYNVTYGAKDGGEDITREIRVFCKK